MGIKYNTIYNKATDSYTVQPIATGRAENRWSNRLMSRQSDAPQATTYQRWTPLKSGGYHFYYTDPFVEKRLAHQPVTEAGYNQYMDTIKELGLADEGNLYMDYKKALDEYNDRWKAPDRDDDWSTYRSLQDGAMRAVYGPESTGIHQDPEAGYYTYNTNDEFEALKDRKYAEAMQAYNARLASKPTFAKYWADQRAQQEADRKFSEQQYNNAMAAAAMEAAGIRSTSDSDYMPDLPQVTKTTPSVEKKAVLTRKAAPAKRVNAPARKNPYANFANTIVEVEDPGNNIGQTAAKAQQVKQVAVQDAMHSAAAEREANYAANPLVEQSAPQDTILTRRDVRRANRQERRDWNQLQNKLTQFQSDLRNGAISKEEAAPYINEFNRQFSQFKKNGGSIIKAKRGAHSDDFVGPPTPVIVNQNVPVNGLSTLDRKYAKYGYPRLNASDYTEYRNGDDYTVYTSPTDTAIVMGPAHGAIAGTVLTDPEAHKTTMKMMEATTGLSQPQEAIDTRSQN